MDGGAIRVLSGYFSCEPTRRRDRWGGERDVLSELPPLPLVMLADHNSVMAPGEDSATVTKDVSPVARSRQKEGHVLHQLEVDDVWVCVHGENREEAVKGYTHMAKQRRIDRIHVQPVVLPFVRSAYPVATPSDHKAVVMQLGPPEGPTCPARFRFPLEALSDEVAMCRQGQGLQQWVDRDLGPMEWWAGVTGFLQREAREWRQAYPTSGYTELHSLVRESTPLKLAVPALEYLEELGYSPRTVGEGYGLLISLLANQRKAMFKSAVIGLSDNCSRGTCESRVRRTGDGPSTTGYGSCESDSR